MRGTKRSRPGLAILLLEGGLWLSVATCGAWFGTGAVHAAIARQQADSITVENHPADSKAVFGQPIGRLQIAGIGLSVPLLENYDAATLRRGVGHVPGTAVPGGLGNLVLAGHRDTFFRPLRNIRAGMEAEVIAPSGRWRYIVDSTEIVDPDHLEVLDIGERPEMTLITCFPFDFIGAAPHRFIVHAHLLSVSAE